MLSCGRRQSEAVCVTQKGHRKPWAGSGREGKVPHHSLAKPELSPGALGLCPSWEVLSGSGKGSGSSPFLGSDGGYPGLLGWRLTQALPICSGCLWRLPKLLLNHGTGLSSSRPQEAGPRLAQCLQEPCRHSVLGHLMPVLPIHGQHNPDEAAEVHWMPRDHHLVPEVVPASRACAQALGEEHWVAQLHPLAQQLQGSSSPLGLELVPCQHQLATLWL